jgi:DNA-binding transcriptional MerR regulator
MSPDATGPAYRTISDVAALVGVPHHVLRFWEGKFPAIAPLKRGGNRRYYRPEDVAAIERIARLLHVEGYTIKGAQKLLAGEATARPEPAIRPAATPPAVPAPAPSPTGGVPLAAIAAIRADLAAALAAVRAG